MYRRARRTREIPFSFDSFLDVVANVVGIIIRLILVVWVGARSYSSVQHLARTAAPSAERPASVSAPLPELRDPLQEELARHRQALDEAQARLLEQLRQLQQVEDDHRHADGELRQVATREEGLEAEESSLDRASAERGQAGQRVALTLDELRR